MVALQLRREQHEHRYIVSCEITLTDWSLASVAEALEAAMRGSLELQRLIAEDAKGPLPDPPSTRKATVHPLFPVPDPA